MCTKYKQFYDKSRVEKFVGRIVRQGDIVRINEGYPSEGRPELERIAREAGAELKVDESSPTANAFAYSY